MTKTAHTKQFFVNKEEFAQSVDALLEKAGSGCTLTMTIKRSNDGAFCVSDAMLHSETTSR